MTVCQEWDILPQKESPWSEPFVIVSRICFFSVVFIVRIVYNVYNEYNVRNVHNILILLMYGYIIICVATINLFYLCEIVYF